MNYFTAIIIFGLMLTGCNKNSDQMSEITHISGKPLSINRLLFIERHDNGKQYLSTGESIDNYPKSFKDYNSSPKKFPIPIVDELPVGTKFAITGLRNEEKFAAGSFSWFSVEILNGKYAGTEFTNVSPSELIIDTNIPPKKWKLKSSIIKH